MSVNRSLRKDDTLSTKSDSPKYQVDELHEWLGELSLSRTTKNLPRDFSDAVLMSEVLRFFYPRIVEPHNYIPANSVQMKTENWNTLNRRVMTKLDMRLNKETIRCLASSQPGTIERVLIEFREKLGGSITPPLSKEEIELARASLDAEEPLEQTKNEPVTEEVAADDKSVAYLDVPEQPELPNSKFGWLMNGFGMGSWFSSNKIPKPLEHQAPIQTEEIIIQETTSIKSVDEEPESIGRNFCTTLNNANIDGALRQAYERQLRELRMKNETINTLHRKVAFLEGTLKLKDVKIANLQSEINMDVLDSAASRLNNFTRPSSQKSQRRRI